MDNYKKFLSWVIKNWMGMHPDEYRDFLKKQFPKGIDNASEKKLKETVDTILTSTSVNRSFNMLETMLLGSESKAYMNDLNEVRKKYNLTPIDSIPNANTFIVNMDAMDSIQKLENFLENKEEEPVKKKSTTTKKKSATTKPKKKKKEKTLKSLKDEARKGQIYGFSRMTKEELLSKLGY